tara:strand:- start:329 stop:589 length:261 start_codon:yes stop_codon:yes gene_type:complete
MNKSYKLNSNIIVELIEDSFVLLDVKKNTFYEANNTSKEIIEMIKNNMNEKEIIETLIKKYNDLNIRKDVNDYIQELLKNNIICEK